MFFVCEMFLIQILNFKKSAYFKFRILSLILQMLLLN